MEKEFKKDLIALLIKYDAELRGYDKPVWPEQDPERGVLVEFNKTGNEICYGEFINSSGSQE